MRITRARERVLSLLLPALALACAVATARVEAQSVYVPDDQASAGACDAVPFGGSPHWNHQRVQVLVRRAELGAQPRVIRELAIASCASGERAQSYLRVAMAEVPEGFSFEGRTRFEENLATIPGSARIVLERRDHRWTTAAGSFGALGLEQNFFASGAHDLLIEIYALGNAFRASGSGSAGVRHAVGRARLAVRSSSPWLQPPLVGEVANSAPKLALDCGGGRLERFGTGCHGMQLALGGSALRGTAITVEVFGAPDGEPLQLLVGSSTPSPLLPLDLAALGSPGCSLYLSPEVTTLWPPPVQGTLFLQFAVPRGPDWLGARVYLQWLVFDRAQQRLVTSGYGRVLVG